MEVPEFDIFKRLEVLEKKTWKVSTLDALIVALVALDLAFVIVSYDHPESAREWRDDIIAKLQKGGLSRHWLDLISEDLNDWLDLVYPEEEE